MTVVGAERKTFLIIAWCACAWIHSSMDRRESGSYSRSHEDVERVVVIAFGVRRCFGCRWPVGGAWAISGIKSESRAWSYWHTWRKLIQLFTFGCISVVIWCHKQFYFVSLVLHSCRCWREFLADKSSTNPSAPPRRQRAHLSTISKRFFEGFSSYII